MAEQMPALAPAALDRLRTPQALLVLAALALSLGPVFLFMATGLAAGPGGDDIDTTYRLAVEACSRQPPASPPSPASPTPTPFPTGEPTTGRLPSIADIPARYLQLYRAAAAQYQVDWALLAAIGHVESNHGRDAGRSSAGALGPMQFMPATWRSYGVDGNHDGLANIHDPADAIPAAARYLKASGVDTNRYQAIYAYNHADWYVKNVEKWAATYTTAGRSARLPPPTEPGGSGPADLAELCSAINGDIGTALPPAASAAIRKVLAYARAQLGKPYVWGAQGPDAFDCSGLTMMAYHAAGIDIPRTTFDQWRHGARILVGHEQPGDLVFFNSGPGSGPDNPGHVGLVISQGRMINAPGRGDVVKIADYKARDDFVGFARPTQGRR